MVPSKWVILFVAGRTFSGKVRAMLNERGKRLTTSGPATPVMVLGLSGAPQAGDCSKSTKTTRKHAKSLPNVLRLPVSKQPGNQADLFGRNRTSFGVGKLQRIELDCERGRGWFCRSLGRLLDQTLDRICTGECDPQSGGSDHRIRYLVGFRFGRHHHWL